MYKRIVVELSKEFPSHNHRLTFEEWRFIIYVELRLDDGNEEHRYRFDADNLDKAWKKFHSLMGKYISQGFEVSQSVIETRE